MSLGDVSIVGPPAVAKAGVWGVDYGYFGRERGIWENYLPLSFAVDLKLFFFNEVWGRGHTQNECYHLFQWMEKLRHGEVK